MVHACPFLRLSESSRENSVHDGKRSICQLDGGSWCTSLVIYNGDLAALGLQGTATERVVRLAWPGNYLRERGCPGVRDGAPSDLVVAIGTRPSLLVAELREGRGQVLFPESQ